MQIQDIQHRPLYRRSSHQRRFSDIGASNHSPIVYGFAIARPFPVASKPRRCRRQRESRYRMPRIMRVSTGHTCRAGMEGVCRAGSQSRDVCQSPIWSVSCPAILMCVLLCTQIARRGKVGTATAEDKQGRGANISGWRRAALRVP